MAQITQQYSVKIVFSLAGHKASWKKDVKNTACNVKVEIMIEFSRKYCCSQKTCTAQTSSSDITSMPRGERSHRCQMKHLRVRLQHKSTHKGKGIRLTGPPSYVFFHAFAELANHRATTKHSTAVSLLEILFRLYLWTYPRFPCYVSELSLHSLI